MENLGGVLHFDGSCWPNPGPNSRCAFILKYGTTIVERTIELGEGTNNTAEYHGILHGLRAAIAAGVTDLEVYGDSQLVINGVKKYPSKKSAANLWLLRVEAILLLQKFRSVDLNWVPREENAEADALT